MDLRLLGPVEIRAGDDEVVDTGQPRQRAVLAALAVDVRRLVTVESLVDRVWGEQPPAGARRALYSHIARVRRVLARAGALDGRDARVVRRSGGYLLDVAPEWVDLHRFRGLVHDANGSADGERARLLRTARGLWRGEPLAGVPGRWAARMREVWRQEHLEATLAWARTELRVGGPGAVIAPLTELAGDHPLVESVAAALIQALHTAGRTAEALDRYAAVRQLLADELGADPGAELQRLHLAILRGDPKVSGRPAAPRPAQLPSDVPGFTGRDEQLATLSALTTPVAAISGTAGVGKTALAVHWAHLARSRFPDGQLYVNLRGFDPGGRATSPAEAVRGFLDALQVPPERVPHRLEAQVGLYRSLLAGRRVLLVLDNARDAEQVRPLLPGESACLALVTSRNQLPALVALDGAYPVPLGLISAGEARRMLAARLGRERVAAEPRAVSEIIERCAELPLALAVVAARAATHPTFTLAVIAAELRDARNSLDAFAGDDPFADVRTVLSWSYRALGADAARLFRLLGLHPGPDITAPAAAGLAGISPRSAPPLLAELTRAQLLTEQRPGRYGFHDLLRAYAIELTHAHDPGPERHLAVRRMLDHYLHTADAAYRLLDPQRTPTTLVRARPAATVERLADQDEALAWFTAEHAVLVAAIGRAARDGLHDHAWRLSWAFGDFLFRRGHWDDVVATQQVALDSSSRATDLDGQAHAHQGLALAYARLGRHDDAHAHLEDAVGLYAKLGDHVQQAHAHANIGYVLERQGRQAESLVHSELALDLFQAAGDTTGRAYALNVVGWGHALLGDHQLAIAYCEQALALQQRLGDRVGEADTWDSLGYAHHHLGDHRRAIACYRHGLDLLRDLGDRYHEAETLTRIGDTHHADNDDTAARAAWRLALTITEDLGHPDADLVRSKLRSTR